MSLSSKRIKIKKELKDGLNTAEEIRIRDERKIIYELCEAVLNVIQFFEQKKNNPHPDLSEVLDKVYHYVVQQAQCAFWPRFVCNVNKHTWSSLSTAIRYDDLKVVKKMLYSLVNERCDEFLRSHYYSDSEDLSEDDDDSKDEGSLTEN